MRHSLTIVQKVLAGLLSVAIVVTSVPQSARATQAIPEFVQKLSLPPSLAHITDYAPGSKHVVLIQDLHLHYPTQKRIVKILERLQAQGTLQGRVAIEGTHGDFDTSVLASYPAGKTKERLVDYFMKKGELSGDEAYSVLTGQSHVLYGVEDAKFYELNRELYKQTLAARKKIREPLATIQEQVSYLKRKNYNRALHRLDKEVGYGISEYLLGRKLAAAETPLQKNLVQVDHSLGLLTRLLHQQVTLEETRYIAQRLPQFVKLTEKLLGSSSTLLPSLSSLNLEDTLKAAIDFYAVALMRNGPMAANTLSLLDKQNTVVLISGGFHTAGLTKAFKDAGVGYVVITPQVDVKPDQAYAQLYEDRVSGHHVTQEQVNTDFHISSAVQSLGVRSYLFGPAKNVFLWTANQLNRLSGGARTVGGGRISQIDSAINLVVENGQMQFVNLVMAFTSQDQLVRDSVGRILKENPALGDNRTEFYLVKHRHNHAIAYNKKFIGSKKVALDSDVFENLADIAQKETPARQEAARVWTDMLIAHELRHSHRPTWPVFALGAVVIDAILSFPLIYLWINLNSEASPFNLILMVIFFTTILLVLGLVILGPLLWDWDEEKMIIRADVSNLGIKKLEQPDLIGDIEWVARLTGTSEYFFALKRMVNDTYRHSSEDIEHTENKLLWAASRSLFWGGRTIPGIPEHSTPKEVMKLKEAAEYLGIAVDTLYKYLVEGKSDMPAFKLGNRWRFKKSLLDSWMVKESERLEKPKSGRSKKIPGILFILGLAHYFELLPAAMALFATGGLAAAVPWPSSKILSMAGTIKILVDSDSRDDLNDLMLTLDESRIREIGFVETDLSEIMPMDYVVLMIGDHVKHIVKLEFLDAERSQGQVGFFVGDSQINTGSLRPYRLFRLPKHTFLQNVESAVLGIVLAIGLYHLFSNLPTSIAALLGTGAGGLAMLWPSHWLRFPEERSGSDEASAEKPSDENAAEKGVGEPLKPRIVVDKYILKIDDAARQFVASLPAGSVDIIETNKAGVFDDLKNAFYVTRAETGLHGAQMAKEGGLQPIVIGLSSEEAAQMGVHRADAWNASEIQAIIKKTSSSDTSLLIKGTGLAFIGNGATFGDWALPIAALTVGIIGIGYLGKIWRARSEKQKAANQLEPVIEAGVDMKPTVQTPWQRSSVITTLLAKYIPAIKNRLETEERLKASTAILMALQA